METKKRFFIRQTGEFHIYGTVDCVFPGVFDCYWGPEASDIGYEMLVIRAADKWDLADKLEDQYNRGYVLATPAK